MMRRKATLMLTMINDRCALFWFHVCDCYFLFVIFLSNISF